MNVGILYPNGRYITNGASVGIDDGSYYTEYIRNKYFTVLKICLHNINYTGVL